MAAARMPRLCATIPSIDCFTTNSTYCLLRSLPPRSQVLFTRCRARTARATSQLPARRFSAASTSMSDPIEPLRQEAGAKARREETIQEQEASASNAISEEHSTPAAETSASNLKASMPESTPHAPTTPSNSPTPAQSDLDFLTTSRRITGTVIRTHTMAKTVAVSTTRQHFDRFLQKHYTRPSKTLVHDPQETLVEGDVIEYGLFPPFERAERIKKGKGKGVKYVVREVVTPFGMPLDQRLSRRRS